MDSVIAMTPKITFGIIVLNGEPFTRHTVRALYPFAHEIIVVEGAAPGARNIALANGHSRDGTLDSLRSFQAEEDPDGKVVIVTAEDAGHPDGFWPGEKDEQSRAYARRAQGDYLWQVDIDEFYRSQDMEHILAMLAQDPTISGASFKQITFWGGLDYRVDGWYLRGGADIYHRLFRWEPGSTYVTHRPPTVRDPWGSDVRDGNYLDGRVLARQGITLYHYSLLFPKQVIEKCDYYETADWSHRTGARRWAEDTFVTLRRPYRVHNVPGHPSWIERYDGPHPDTVVEMMASLESSGATELRPTDDIEELLASRRYRVGRHALSAMSPFQKPLTRVQRRFDRVRGHGG